MNIILVGAGGGLGAICRYGLSKLLVSAFFPFATLLTNLLGAFFIGFIAGMAERRSDGLVLFLKTGFCGGFTTFSTFSLEAVGLLEKQQYLSAVTYMILSVILCLGGVVLGEMCSKKFF